MESRCSPTKSRYKNYYTCAGYVKEDKMWLCVDGVLGASQAPTTWWMEEPSAHARMYFFDIRLFENFERVGKHKREVARVNGGKGKVTIISGKLQRFILKMIPLTGIIFVTDWKQVPSHNLEILSLRHTHARWVCMLWLGRARILGTYSKTRKCETSEGPERVVEGKYSRSKEAASVFFI